MAKHQPVAENFNEAQTLAHRGENYRLMQDFSLALANFNCAIELNPHYAWAIAHRGEAYYLMKRYPEALNDFNSAIELNRNYTWAFAHRGVTYQYMRQFEAAIADFNRAIELHPEYAWAFAHRCRTYEQMKYYEKGLADFDRAIAIDPTIIPHWHSERGLLLSFMKRYADSIEYYQQGLKENSQDYLAIYGIASVLTLWKGLAETQANIAEVRSILLSIINTGNRSFALYGLGGLAALEGETNQALNYLQTAISLDEYRRETARHDLAWTSLQSHPKFRELIYYEI